MQSVGGHLHALALFHGGGFARSRQCETRRRPQCVGRHSRSQYVLVWCGWAWCAGKGWGVVLKLLFFFFFDGGVQVRCFTKRKTPCLWKSRRTTRCNCKTPKRGTVAYTSRPTATCRRRRWNVRWKVSVSRRSGGWELACTDSLDLVLLSTAALVTAGVLPAELAITPTELIHPEVAELMPMVSLHRVCCIVCVFRAANLSGVYRCRRRVNLC